METVKKIGSIIYSAFFVCLILIAAVVAVSAFKIPGSYKLLTVQSGSMEPAIRTGSIVVVQPQKLYRKGDVITTSKASSPKVSVTHRILKVKNKDKKLTYITKGDANNTADTEERLPEQVMGKVLFSVPFLGYPVAFAKTRTGLIVLIIIPSTMIVYGEMLNIKNEVVNLLKKKKKKKLNPVEAAELAVGREELKIEKQTKKWWHTLFKKK
jgi:signal peptidase I